MIEKIQTLIESIITLLLFLFSHLNPIYYIMKSIEINLEEVAIQMISSLTTVGIIVGILALIQINKSKRR